MASTLEIVRGISQALSNKHDGALDEEGNPIKTGLKREGEDGIIPLHDKRVMDGFNVSFHGDQLCIHYHGEVTMKEVHNKSFESDMEQMIADISKFIKKQYRGATKSSLTLKKEGDIDVMVQSVGRHRSWVQAKQYFSYGSDADSIANESDDKLDSAIKNFIELGRDGAKKNAADSRSASDKKAPENNMRGN